MWWETRERREAFWSSGAFDAGREKKRFLLHSVGCLHGPICCLGLSVIARFHVLFFFKNKRNDVPYVRCPTSCWTFRTRQVWGAANGGAAKLMQSMTSPHPRWPTKHTFPSVAALSGVRPKSKHAQSTESFFFIIIWLWPYYQVVINWRTLWKSHAVRMGAARHSGKEKKKNKKTSKSWSQERTESFCGFFFFFLC